MKVLLKREQRPGFFGKVTFKLWAMLEVNEDERTLIERYDIDKSVVLIGDDTGLWRVGASFGLGIAIVTFLALFFLLDFGWQPAGAVALLVFIVATYWCINELRQTIFMKDLLHGRSFNCFSIVELAKKEAVLEYMCQALRQVVESAKHWDGVEHRDVIVLPPEEAKAFIVKVFP
ncbi:MAG: hypothetical protein QNI87_01875 [Erythrobacter sp.]|uniref:hypothetical protein n=1 Tax=Erythrobacter sp. TaxID=1042 RepID=UPI0026182532|nr:hypothetical protein [Erythrobacter sp.]MDJ0977263.1 hypothetical protein [Erythrobacter sp.]